MIHRLMFVLVLVGAAACGGGSSNSASTTPAPVTPAPAPAAAPAQSGSAQPCGYDIINAAKSQGGACLEPAVLGAETATQCEAYLVQNGWQRDGAAETAIGQQTGKTIMCFRAPAAPAP